MVKNGVVRFVTLVCSHLVLLQSMSFQPVLGGHVFRDVTLQFQIEVAFIAAAHG